MHQLFTETSTQLTYGVQIDRACACSVTKWMHLHSGDAAMHQPLTGITSLSYDAG